MEGGREGEREGGREGVGRKEGGRGCSDSRSLWYFLMAALSS